MQNGNQNRHNVNMSEMPQDEKPAIEEDAKLARILGVVLFVVFTVFGFYYGSVFGKEWYFDYRMQDIRPSMLGAGIGFFIAIIANGYIWLKFKSNMDRDMNFEWYEPQSHRSDHHH